MRKDKTFQDFLKRRRQTAKSLALPAKRLRLAAFLAVGLAADVVAAPTQTSLPSPQPASLKQPAQVAAHQHIEEAEDEEGEEMVPVD